MTARTDFSELRSIALAHQMGAKLSQPATRVDADAPMTTKVYPRTLEQAFGPYHRSGSAWIVTAEESESPWAKAGIAALFLAAIALVCLLPELMP